MSALDHDRLTRRFLDAVDLDGAARQSFLDRVRSEEPDLYQDLSSLLRHDGDPPRELKTGAPARSWDDLEPGARVGAYRILRRIGGGGMGVVYLADQHDPVRRVVALKLIRPGFESRNVAARFEAERRALERLDHPGIARVLDAGTTDDQRPYFVMEWVRGEPITAFAEAFRLDVRARMRLFARVCDAVHHAHQNAILHRDVKPSNVLVSMVDGAPVPKVIDFGIAKALARDPGAAPTLTEAGQLVGTPGYMSPEQARSAGDDVDIRSDVYSLGCLLHELLVGCPPFDASAFRGLPWEEIRATLSSLEPPPPSTTLSRRGPAPRGLARQLRGDIDWIVLKAIARERDDRYASAHDLASDVRRFLDDEPVEARPASRLYRFRKFAARHRAGVAAAAAAIPLLLGFGTVMAFQAHRLARERDRAEEISEFLVGFTALSRDVTSRGDRRSLSDVPWNGLDKVRRTLGDRPVLAARLEHAVGESLRVTGDATGALPVLEGARSRLAALLGADDRRTLVARHDLARALRDLARYPEAERELRSVLAARTRVLGRAHPDTLRTIVELGMVKKLVRAFPEAAELLSEGRSGLVAALGPGDPEVAFATSLLGSVELDLDRLDEAEAHVREAIARLDERAPERPVAVYNLGCILAKRGRRPEAIASIRDAIDDGFVISFFADPNLGALRHDREFEALAKSALVFGRETQEEMVSEASFEIRRGRLDRAEAIYRYAIAVLRTPYNGFVFRLGDLLVLEGRYAEALPIVRAALEATRHVPGVRSSEIGIRLVDVAQVELGCGDRAAALATLAEASRIFESDTGYGAPQWVHYARACRQAIAGDLESALRSLQASVEAGFRGAERLRGDLALRPLHGRPEFGRMLDLLSWRYGFSAPEIARSRDGVRSSAHD